jgi:type I restriction enzyme S subunit
VKSESFVQVSELALNTPGAFKIGPFGSSLKKSELVQAGVPVVGIENVLPNRFIKGFRRFITPQKYEQLSDYEILPNDVLVTTMGTIGRAAAAPLDLGRAIFDSHLFRMRLNTSRVFPPYFCYALNSDFVARQLSQMAHGAIMEGLNTTILKECLIPLPDLPRQRQIAARLDETDRLCRTRRYALELSDSFLPAAFLEMFGDPIKNPNGFPRQPLEELILPARPITYGILKPGVHIADGVPYVRVVDIYDDRVVPTYVRRTTKEIDNAYKRSRLKAGDLLLSIRGEVGRLGIVPSSLEGANITQDTARLAPIDSIDTRYLMGCLASEPMQSLMRSLVKGVAVQGINLGDVKELLIPIPQMSLQKQFAAMVIRYEHLRSLQRESLRQADHLFQSLLHEAFSPQLD